MSDARATLQRAVAAALTATTAAARGEAVTHVAEELDRFAAEEAARAEEIPANYADSRKVPSHAQSGTVLPDLSDLHLRDFNLALPWAAMTLDESGRVIGNAWSTRKRNSPHPLIDKRHIEFDAKFPLAGKHVFEAGCFEGIHTLGCLLLGARVTGADSRIANILKTLARLWIYGRHCDLVLWDFEEAPPATAPETWDVLHHIGVLYHLSDPVGHLIEMLKRTGEALLLDTHVAQDEASAAQSYEVDGETYRYSIYREKDMDVSPFAGMRQQVKWLLLDDLEAVIARCGFRVDHVVNREERNGRRVLIHAFR